MKNLDVIVVGAGHAGIEAALAASRMGSKVLLITHSMEDIGQLSCNPAIGGLGKSQLVKEIDAMGGLMGIVVDYSGIQFRTLNQSKGGAVRSTRAQIDRALYGKYSREMVWRQEGLSIFQQSVEDVIIKSGRVAGVKCNGGIEFRAPCVILCNGTFLSGVTYIGSESKAAGRAGSPSSVSLSLNLRELGIKQGRLKTGTPPRVDKRTVDFSDMQEQWGDDDLSMSYMGKSSMHPQQTCCWISRTSMETKTIVEKNIHLSPVFSGIINGTGPRYCPSIEDKIYRFSDKDTHQVFVEPEGLGSYELYLNGVSTSLPFEVQKDMVCSIQGFEKARITRPGYAVEYDYFHPTGLKETMEVKNIEGLFFAGQINGTTGYEEAGGQGLLAGINAALKSKQKPPFILGREESYVGVMIDDLITLGTEEPYRMFTSRAEFRMMLREDNADVRLTEKARDFGLVSEDRWKVFCDRREQIEKGFLWLDNSCTQEKEQELRKEFEIKRDKKIRPQSLRDFVKRPEVSLSSICEIYGKNFSGSAMDYMESEIKYSGYIENQKEGLQRLKRLEGLVIPDDFDYMKVKGLSNEVRQKLSVTRPSSIGQASRISGVTQPSLSLLLVYLKRVS